MKDKSKHQAPTTVKGLGLRVRKDCGQVVMFVMIGMGIFLLGFIGLGVDMTNLWLHRQTAQSAADAVCVAGAMDMLTTANTGNPAGLFTPGTPFDCSSGPGSGGGLHLPASAPCQYAVLNGYNGPVLTGNGAKEGNLVSVSFPPTIPGVNPPVGPGAPANPFMRVDITDRVKIYFASLLAARPTMDVTATAKCGLQGSTGPVPLLVLNPTEGNTFSNGGGGNITIFGGPTRSIQVNSCASAIGARLPCQSVDAAYVHGTGNGYGVDLRQGGPSYTGSSFGVTGGPYLTPPLPAFITNSPGEWDAPAAPLQDPFKTLAPPPLAVPGQLGVWQQAGGYVYARVTRPGIYTAGIQLQSATALFQPGVYYIEGIANGYGFVFASNSIARPTDPSGPACGAIPVPPCHTKSPSGVNLAAGDGSRGTVFYLTCATPGACTSAGGASPEATVVIKGNSGSGVTVTPGYTTSLVQCPNGPAIPTELNLPVTLDGNVLVGPCTTNGTYETTPTNVGPFRGMLFFQDRSAVPAAGMAEMHGGGGLLLAGAEYFHNCPNSMIGPCSNPPTNYETSLGLWGGTGNGTSLYGVIVVDKLSLQGGAAINMALMPNNYLGLSAALLQ